MNEFFWGLVFILGVGGGFIHAQGMSMMVLSGLFGAVDGVQAVIEQNPANPHPTVKLPPE